MTIRFSIAKEPEGLKQITINLRGTDAFRIVKYADLVNFEQFMRLEFSDRHWNRAMRALQI